MVKVCAAFECTNRYNPESEISFHKLPKRNREKVRKEWLKNIKRDGKLPKDEYFYICSKHFEDECFERDLKVRIQLFC